MYVRSRIHFFLVGIPGFAEVFARLDKTGFTRITPETKLVIEGCPRSGNSYALAAFTYSNPDLKVTSHRHSPTSVRTAQKRGIANMVIIRPPRACIASGLQYYPTQPPKWAIKVYQDFYEGILPLADKALIATFDEVISDFGEVIRRCNSRFRTTFAQYDPTPESEAAVRATVDRMGLDTFDPAELPRVAGRPSGARKSPEELLSALDPELVREIDELDKLYNAVLLHR